MDKDLSSYVKVYKGLMPEELRLQTLGYLQLASWKRDAFYAAKLNQHVEREEIQYYTQEVLPNTQQINAVIWKALESYILKDFNFPWHDGWNGFSSPKYLKYSATNSMELHCDHIHSLFTGDRKGIPVMTAIVLLNDDFEGGEFEMFDGMEIDLKKGDVVVFPSNFLFPHRVRKITNGTRHVAVFWSW